MHSSASSYEDSPVSRVLKLVHIVMANDLSTLMQRSCKTWMRAFTSSRCLFELELEANSLTGAVTLSPSREELTIACTAILDNARSAMMSVRDVNSEVLVLLHLPSQPVLRPGCDLYAAADTALKKARSCVIKVIEEAYSAAEKCREVYATFGWVLQDDIDFGAEMEETSASAILSRK